MSRSYKKNPVVKDSSRKAKKFANHRVRNRLGTKHNRIIAFGNGSQYKKLFCSYDISDWLFRETWLEYSARAEEHKKEYENGVMRWGIRISKDFSNHMSYWDWWKTYKRK